MMEKMSEPKKRAKYIVPIVIFIVISIISLLILTYNPLVGTVLILLLLLFIFVGGVIKAYCINGTSDAKWEDGIWTLSEKQIKDTQNLLRYATAALAFISLLTTASGMNGLVFDSAWMAYFASFAVQSVLVVFSLWLCRFIVRVSSLNWPAYVKKLAKGGILIFFCVFLIVSSTFSFCYIANNAYRKNWSNDSEMIIQNHLINATYELKNENEYRRKEILQEINNSAQHTLLPAVEALQIQQKEEFSKDLTDVLQFLENKYVNRKEDVSAVDINYNNWRSTFMRYSNDIDYLYVNYMETYADGYSDVAQTYNNIINQVRDWKNGDEIYLEAQKIISDLEEKISELEILVFEIDDWKTYNLDKDLSPYRGIFKSKANILISRLENLKNDISSIVESSGRVANIDQNKLDISVEKMDQLLSEIYLLGVDDQIKSDDLIKQINEVLVNGRKTIESEVIQDVVLLKQRLILYERSYELSENLDSYIRERLSKTYKISNLLDDEENLSNSAINKRELSESQINDNDIEIEEDSVHLVSQKNWEENRNNDFYDFYTFVKLLPNTEGVLLETDQELHERYDDTGALADASLLQRDLLGEITDIERAFNYFKYDFPLMAFCSAFIAVFFDLGAFFAGCFIYITEFFSKENFCKAHSEQMRGESSNCNTKQ